jgi:EAL domain-containing protein (putative c-di-GMP-specific phosphodiesterase class I)
MRLAFAGSCRMVRTGCPLGQGYWFAKPLDVAGAEELLVANNTS